MSDKLGLSQQSRVKAAIAAIESACRVDLEDDQDVRATGIRCGLVAAEAGSTTIARNYLGLVYRKSKHITTAELEELTSIGELMGLWVLGRRELKKGR